MSINLKENQLIAAELLSTGMSAKIVSETLNIRPETLSRWRLQKEFIDEVNNKTENKCSYLEKRFLKGQRAKYYSPSKVWHEGTYMFTIDSCHADSNLLNTTFSELPTQHKSFNILKLDNGYFAAQPNNRMLIYDKSYSPKQLKFPDFKVSSIEYSVEDKQKITFGDDDEFFYGIKEKK